MARAKHYSEANAIHHVTTRTLERKPYLAKPVDKQLVLNALDFYRRRGDFALYGFVVMDNHLHIVIRPKNGCGLARIADNLKTWISRRNSAKPAGSRLWERRYDDNAIQSQREMHQALDYLHNNPIRAHLVERAGEYPWSSIHNYLGGGKALIEVDTDWQG